MMGMQKGFKLVGKGFKTERASEDAARLYFSGQKVHVGLDNGWIIYMNVAPQYRKKQASWKKLPTRCGESWGYIANNFATTVVALC